MEQTASAGRVLLVDDTRTLRKHMRETLEAEGFQVTEAEDAESGIELFRADPFPVVFSDIVMPGKSGIDLLAEIKQTHPDTQVIMVTGHGSLDFAIMALRLGANEYLVKPFEDMKQVAHLARQAFAKLRQISANDAQVEILRKQLQALEQTNREFKELSIRDGLTGLYNHRYFQASLSVELSRAERHGREFSLVFIDVDHFKRYNDTHGHPAGDQILKDLGEIVQARLRSPDIFCRYGGEEFTLILPETSKANALKVAENIRAQIEAHPFAGRETQPQGGITASLGVATYPADGSLEKELVNSADQALYKAKQAGRNRVCAAGE